MTARMASGSKTAHRINTVRAFEVDISEEKQKGFIKLIREWIFPSVSQVGSVKEREREARYIQ
jgi:hypothetical protein